MDTRNKDRGVVAGILLIFLGSVFLLVNSGIVSGEVWLYLWRFWPVILILGGVHLILGNSMIADIILAVLAVVMFGLALGASLYQINSPLLDQWGLGGLPWNILFNNINWRY